MLEHYSRKCGDREYLRVERAPVEEDGQSFGLTMTTSRY